VRGSSGNGTSSSLSGCPAGWEAVELTVAALRVLIRSLAKGKTRGELTGTKCRFASCRHYPTRTGGRTAIAGCGRRNCDHTSGRPRHFLTRAQSGHSRIESKPGHRSRSSPPSSVQQPEHYGLAPSHRKYCCTLSRAVTLPQPVPFLTLRFFSYPCPYPSCCSWRFHAVIKLGPNRPFAIGWILVSATGNCPR